MTDLALEIVVFYLMLSQKKVEEEKSNLILKESETSFYLLKCVVFFESSILTKRRLKMTSQLEQIMLYSYFDMKRKHFYQTDKFCAKRIAIR